MHIVNIDRLTVNHAGREVFRDLSWAIGDRDRIGLVGPNGSGKSSLLQAIAGQVVPDSGMVTLLRGVRIGMLRQDVEMEPGRTLWDEVSRLPARLQEVDSELQRIERSLADPAVYGNPDRLARVLVRQQQASEQYEALGGLRHEARAREILTRLGFSPQNYDLESEALSGGQKKLAALAVLALEGPEVLLLDEPDNQLDIEAKQHLESFIRNYPGAIVIVSHDRYLLDETVNQIAELDAGRLTVFPGNYGDYATETELRRLRQQQLYVAQQKRVAQIEAAIKRFEHWAAITEDEGHARQARHRRRMLERMEENGEMIERVTERRRMNLQMDGWRGSTKALEIKDLAMGFGDELLFMNVHLLIQHGERIGLVGPNGAGKSILFRLILGELEPLDGTIRIGPSSRIGYYSQEHQTLSNWLDRSPLALVRDTKPMAESEAVAFLLRFLFKYEQMRLPIRGFSGGERSRLQLACLVLQNPNLLLLDEPTNNLDIPSVEALEAALEDFEGVILTISHDRYFLDRVVDRIIELDGTAHSYPGGYSDYLEARSRQSNR